MSFTTLQKSEKLSPDQTCGQIINMSLKTDHYIIKYIDVYFI